MAGLLIGDAVPINNGLLPTNRIVAAAHKKSRTSEQKVVTECGLAVALLIRSVGEQTLSALNLFSGSLAV